MEAGLRLTALGFKPDSVMLPPSPGGEVMLRFGQQHERLRERPETFRTFRRRPTPIVSKRAGHLAQENAEKMV